MTEQPAVYRIVSRVHTNQWNEGMQQAVAGWDIRALWTRTGTILPVFCPDTNYTPENVDALIRNAGAKDDAIHSLGG